MKKGEACSPSGSLPDLSAQRDLGIWRHGSKAQKPNQGLLPGGHCGQVGKTHVALETRYQCNSHRVQPLSLGALDTTAGFVLLTASHHLLKSYYLPYILPSFD